MSTTKPTDQHAPTENLSPLLDMMKTLHPVVEELGRLAKKAGEQPQRLSDAEAGERVLRTLERHQSPDQH